MCGSGVALRNLTFTKKYKDSNYRRDLNRMKIILSLFFQELTVLVCPLQTQLNILQEDSTLNIMSRFHKPLWTLKIKLGRQVAQTYVKQISPFHETADLLVQDGNTVASTLIRGNAYQEAVAYLQGLMEELTAKDEYNLGLAFEASGEIPQARNHYELALKRETSNQDFKDAVKRTRN